MSSQLIIVDTRSVRDNFDFSELTHESTETITDYIGEEHALYNLHQYTYQAEFSDKTKLQMFIFWDVVQDQPREDGFEFSEIELAIQKLNRQYEIAIDGYLEHIVHGRLRTISSYRNKEEKIPLTLEWVKIEPPPKEI